MEALDQHRDITVHLTDAEWMSLIDRDRDLGPCCGEIDEIRGWVYCIASDGGRADPYMIREMAKVFGYALRTHSLSGIPALVKFREQLGLGDDEGLLALPEPDLS